MEVGLDDHIRLLISAPPKISVRIIAKQHKGTSSLRLFILHPHFVQRFWNPKGKCSLWSPSYYVESMGAVNEQYLDDQRKKEVG